MTGKFGTPGQKLLPDLRNHFGMIGIRRQCMNKRRADARDHQFRFLRDLRRTRRIRYSTIRHSTPSLEWQASARGLSPLLDQPPGQFHERGFEIGFLFAEQRQPAAAFEQDLRDVAVIIDVRLQSRFDQSRRGDVD